MKVMFDSNIWQQITIPNDYPNDPCLPDFKKINQAISDKKIDGYISEVIFTIEAICKKERQDFFSSTQPKLEFDVREKKQLISEVVDISITIGPNEKDAIHLDERPILKKYFDEARKLGLHIVKFPRFCGLVNPEVRAVSILLEDEYWDKVCEVEDDIVMNGAGITDIEEIGKKYNTDDWLEGLKKAPVDEWKKIAKAAAEWADGDSVATSIGLGCEYFCTRDQAKGAGSGSVLSSKNLAWLGTKYGFKTITPEDLAKII